MESSEHESRLLVIAMDLPNKLRSVAPGLTRPEGAEPVLNRPRPASQLCSSDYLAVAADRDWARAELTAARAQLAETRSRLSAAENERVRISAAADRAYSHPSTRAALRARGIAFTCPERIDQSTRRAAKGSSGGRPPAFHQAIYAGPNVIERCFARLKQFRALATRYAKRAAYYRAALVLAAVVLWLREDPQDTP
jgi:transposase